MPADHIFISHASADDAFVKHLREALEGQQLLVWVDSRNLRGGAKLAPEIQAAIESARHVIAVLSPNTINSPWVRKEIQAALAVEQERKDDGYRVIPLLLPGVQPAALPLWFDEEPVGVRVALEIGELSVALPQILAALGERLPGDPQSALASEAQHVEDLLLKLSNPKIHTRQGKTRVTADAMIVYDPVNPARAREVESNTFRFTAPLGPIEAEDLRWYLESYYLWPTGVFKERAARIEANLPRWGNDLFRALSKTPTAQEALRAWQAAAERADRRFSVVIYDDAPEGSSKKQQIATKIAATALLGLPWELLHDGHGYVFQGRNAVRVRRRLPNRRQQRVATSGLPIRILLVSPRPEDEYTGYIDHRSSALPLVETVENLGELVELTVLTPPTFAAFQQALHRAAEAGTPFDVVHFDGHGVYDRRHGLGGLVFEAPNDSNKLFNRKMQFVDAKEIAATIRDHRIPLVFLEACQSAKAEANPTASVAARLLEEGVTSVVAMSHSVLVETARRFVQAFYAELARGSRVGKAMLAGQQALYADTYRLKIMGAGELHLQDWFVPVLYQEAHDPQLITKLLPRDAQQVQSKQHRVRLGKLPNPPSHHFQGRSRELLALERLLHDQPYAVIRGQGGAGKTTLAVELARWLVRTSRFRRAAFVSLETYTDPRGVLLSLGQQLLPEGDTWHVAPDTDVKQALQPVERALRDQPTLIVLDNMESVLSDPSGQVPAAAPIEELFALCKALLDAAPTTRILFTSRESLPAPFDHARRHVELGALSQTDAIALVSQVMAQEGLTPKADDPGGEPQEIIDLVEAASRHARALVLLAREIARQGVRATTENLHRLMAELHRKHPNDRENSLYASVELSLRRLPPEMRQQIRALGVFHGGGHLPVLAHVMGADVDAARNIAISLIGVGLAEDMGYGHLRLDPALPPYLLNEMDEEEQGQARARWAAGMRQLTNFLYEQRSENPELVATITVLELSNLLALLKHMQNKTSAEQIVTLIDIVESLVANLGRPQALAQVVKIREQVARNLGQWDRAQFRVQKANIERLLQQRKLQAAYVATQHLLQQCLSIGETAYKEHTYDIAMSYNLMGQVLEARGDAENALKHYSEAQQRFQNLSHNDIYARRMVAVVIGRIGNCFRILGRLDKATMAYEEAIRRGEELDDKRGVATRKFQLGIIRRLQGHYIEALKIYEEARDLFGILGEPSSVAIAWHHIGIVYADMRQLELAEQAHRQSLAIEVQQKNLPGEAHTLGELGNLYMAMGRFEGASAFYRQATDIFAKLHDLRQEGFARNNLASALIQLQRYDEARHELIRAIECTQLFGHAAELWNTWALLHKLEQATGNLQAADQARQKAINSYLAYRRDGGESQTNGARLCGALAHAIQQRDTIEAEQGLARLFKTDIPPEAKVFISKLQAILHGDRDPALADDPGLDYDDAAELQLLLENLAKREK